jgi:hypothetical protein
MRVHLLDGSTHGFACLLNGCLFLACCVAPTLQPCEADMHFEMQQPGWHKDQQFSVGAFESQA